MTLKFFERVTEVYKSLRQAQKLSVAHALVFYEPDENDEMADYVVLMPRRPEDYPHGSLNLASFNRWIFDDEDRKREAALTAVVLPLRDGFVYLLLRIPVDLSVCYRAEMQGKDLEELGQWERVQSKDVQEAIRLEDERLAKAEQI